MTTSESTAIWLKENRTVTMTNEDWQTLRTYLLLTSRYAEREAKAWEKLAAETDENGNAKFKSAADNANYWIELGGEIERIGKTLDNI